MNFENFEIISWLKELNDREQEELKIDSKQKGVDWTEEVIIPEIVYDIFPKFEKISWEYCDLKMIYNSEDIKEIFGVEPSKLNTCFSKKYYNLNEKEIEDWSNLGKMIDKKLPVSEILIIYTQ